MLQKLSKYAIESTNLVAFCTAGFNCGCLYWFISENMENHIKFTFSSSIKLQIMVADAISSSQSNGSQFFHDVVNDIDTVYENLLVKEFVVVVE